MDKEICKNAWRSEGGFVYLGILEIKTNDNNVKIINQKLGNRKCLTDDEHILKIFLFDKSVNINNDILKNYLDDIVPSNKEIIYSIEKDDTILTLNDLIRKIRYYNNYLC